MHNDYKDIIALADGEPPVWWDDNGVPRFCEFHPSQLPNIYADEAALVMIGCQACGQKFPVSFSCDRISRLMASGSPPRSLKESILAGNIHYGDPPNTGCCAAGATMNCDDLFVIQYWSRPSHEWERDASLDNHHLPDLAA